MIAGALQDALIFASASASQNDDGSMLEFTSARSCRDSAICYVCLARARGAVLQRCEMSRSARRAQMSQKMALLRDECKLRREMTIAHKACAPYKLKMSFLRELRKPLREQDDFVRGRPPPAAGQARPLFPLPAVVARRCRRPRLVCQLRAAACHTSRPAVHFFCCPLPASRELRARMVRRPQTSSAAAAEPRPPKGARGTFCFERCFYGGESCFGS